MSMLFSHLSIQADTFACITPARDYAVLNRHCYKQKMSTKFKEQGVLCKVVYCSIKFYKVQFWYSIYQKTFKLFLHTVLKAVLLHALQDHHNQDLFGLQLCRIDWLLCEVENYIILWYFQALPSLINMPSKTKQQKANNVHEILWAPCQLVGFLGFLLPKCNWRHLK